jgi:hypothetical protein
MAWGMGLVEAVILFTWFILLFYSDELKVKRREFSMSQIPVRNQALAFSAYRLGVVSEALVFLLAAMLHTGAFGVPALLPAMIVEGLCGIGCVIGAYAVFTHQSWAQTAAIIVQIFILAAVLLGISALVRSPGLQIPINVGLHAIMLVLILIGLSLLAIPATRQAFRRDRDLRLGAG